MNNILQQHLSNVVCKTEQQVCKFNQRFGQDKNTVTSFKTKQKSLGKQKYIWKILYHHNITRSQLQ